MSTSSNGYSYRYVEEESVCGKVLGEWKEGERQEAFTRVHGVDV